MSRIGKRPIPVPAGVDFSIKGSAVTAKGPKGELARTLHPEMEVVMENGEILVKRPSDEERHKALHGLSRTLVANMVEGVSKGFTKTLEISGVGYKAELKPYGVLLSLGFSHTIEYKTPAGVTIKTPNPTTVIIDGASKELVGQVAAEIRSFRKPEPYKGKGVKYQGEVVRRKAGKAGGK
ncbi:MAG: 50S ribosomal protein L6 [Gemmatimonadota bacterium]